MESVRLKQLNKSRLFLILIITIIPLSLVFTLSAVLAASPSAVNDTYSVKEDHPLYVIDPGDILANDSPVTATVVLNSQPITGVLDLITATGEFTYTPPLNFNGVVTFSYFAEADAALSNLAFVTITVDAENDPPIANNDIYTITEDTTLNISSSGVLTNDTDVDGLGLSALLDSSPSSGQLLFPGDGSFVYTPTLDFNGLITFTYFANDTISDSLSSGLVTMTVTAVNDDPTLPVNTGLNISENQTLSITTSHLQAADVDNSDLDLLFTLQTTPTYGNLSLNGSTLAVAGAFTQDDINNNLLAYIHGGNETTTADSFQFSVSDGVTGSIASTVFPITITLTNDPPVANDDIAITSEDTAVSTEILVNDSDIDGNIVTSTIAIDTAPASGLTNIDTISGTITYTPDSNFFGNDSYIYEICDDGNPAPPACSTATVAITVTAVNDPPVANDDLYSADEETTLNQAAPGVLSNDTDVDNGDTKTVVNPDTVSANGATVTVNPDGSFLYNPSVSVILNAMAPGESITDTFSYTISDTMGLTDTAVVSVTVAGVNDAPSAADDIGAANEDNQLTVLAPGVVNNDIDPDTSDSFTVTNYDLLSANGAAITVAANGGYTYDPTGAAALQALDGGDTIDDLFAYTITDNFSDSDTATVTITVSGFNDAPVLNNSGDMRLNNIDEDTTTSGDLVASVLTSDLISPITDADASSVDGIAVIDVTDADGQWQYTTNGGTNWLPFGAVFDSAAVLLDTGSLTRIRFVPDANYNGSAGTITFRAWDRTVGANGQTGFTISATGGTTAFSDALETATLTVAPINDAPVLNNSGNMTLPNVQEDTADPAGDRVASILTSDLANPVTDVDAAAVEGIAVFSVDNSNGTWEYSTSGGAVWTPFAVSTASAMLLNPQAYIRFVPNPDYFGTSGDIAFRAWDQTSGANGASIDSTVNGGTSSLSLAWETAALNVNSVNDIPELDLNGAGGGTGSSATFNEDGGPVIVVEADLSVNDIDDDYFYSATALLTNPLDGSAESLAVTPSISITAGYNSSTGILSLTGMDTKANYELVLRSLTYNNASQNPNSTARIIEVTVNDGADDSATAVSIVTVNPVNDVPVVAVNTGLVVNEGGTGTITNGRLQVTDVDNTNNQLIYTIETIPVNGQLLVNNIPQARNGQFSQVDIDNNRLKYSHDGSETASDSFDFFVSDSSGGLIGATTFTIAMNANNDMPILTVNSELTVDEGGSGVITSSYLQVTDADNTADQILYRLEILPTNGVLQKNGADLGLNAEFYQDDIDNNRITYVHNGGETTSDSFTFAVEDGEGGSIASTVYTIGVTPVNDLPIVDLNGASAGANFAATFIEDGGGIAIVANDLALDDADNPTLASATAVLTNHPDGSAESLSVTVGGTNIAANYNSATGILMLTGPDSLSNFQAALQSLTYNNTSQDPSTADRTVEITANDGTDVSVTRISVLTINAINDAPALVVNAGLTVDAGKSETLDTTVLRVTDVDHAAAELTYTLLSTPTHGVLKLNGSALAVNGAFTQADIDNNRLVYEHDESETTTDSFEFVAEDGDGSATSVATFDIIIRPKPLIFLPVVLNNYVVSEPNDSSCDAHGINLNRAYQFLPDDSEDWYVFTLTSAGKLTFKITNYTPADGQLVIYKSPSCVPSTLQQIGHDSTITPTGQIILLGQTPGDYYVRVISAPIPANPTPYTLEVLFQ